MEGSRGRGCVVGSPTSELEASVENCIPCKCLSAALQPHEKASADSVPAGGLQTVGVRESRELGQSGSARPKGHTDTVCHSEWAAHPLGAPSFVSLSLGAGRGEGLGNQAK